MHVYYLFQSFSFVWLTLLKKDLVVSIGVFTDFNQLNTPHLRYLQKTDKQTNNDKKYKAPSPEQVFGLSILGNCKNMAVNLTDPFPCRY